jgi:hypothetical protein
MRLSVHRTLDEGIIADTRVEYSCSSLLASCRRLYRINLDTQEMKRLYALIVSCRLLDIQDHVNEFYYHTELAIIIITQI